MSGVKRFVQICHANMLNTLIENYCTTFKQTTKPSHCSSFAYRKNIFSTTPASEPISSSFSLCHNFLDQLRVIRQQAGFRQPRRQVKPVAVQGKNLLEQRQALIHSSHVGQRYGVPVNHLCTVRNKL